MKKSRSTRPSFLLSVALLALAASTYVRGDSRFQWLLSIVLTEYGHWFAVFFMLWLVSIPRRASKIVLLVCIFAFWRPAYLASGMESELRKTFGEENAEPWFRWSTLFFGTSSTSIEPKRFKIKTRDGQELETVYFKSIAPVASPLVVVIHGGGWEGGDANQMPEMSAYLAANGFSVASISYRLTPGAKWPTQLQDAEDAVAALRAQATELSIDPNSIYLLGRSAGAQIAGAYAYTRPPSCLKGVVLFYPPTDLTFGWEISEPNDWLGSRNLIEQLIGTPPLQSPEAYKSASIVENVTPKSAPLLTLHGRGDTLVWYKHSERLVARLRSVGVRAEYVDLPWAQHGFDFSPRGPGGQLSSNTVLSFLRSREKTKCGS